MEQAIFQFDFGAFLKEGAKLDVVTQSIKYPNKHDDNFAGMPKHCEQQTFSTNQLHHPSIDSRDDHQSVGI